MSTPSPSKVARQKAFASILGLVVAVFLLEVGASWMGPDAASPETALGEYPSNPRGYFDELPSMAASLSTVLIISETRSNSGP